MTVVAAIAAVSVNAQDFYVGGQLGFTSTTNTTEVSAAGATVSNDLKRSAFTFGPEFGIKLDDKMAVGVALTYGHTNRETGANTEVTGNNFEIKPYFRYAFLQWDKLSLFADAQIGVSTGKSTTDTTVGGVTTSTDVKESGFSFAIVPGISYQLTDQINFVAKLGNGLGYWQTKNEPNNTTTIKDKTFGLNLNSLGLVFGMYYNF